MGPPSAPRAPVKAEDLALPPSLFLRKRDTSFWVPVYLGSKAEGLLTQELHEGPGGAEPKQSSRWAGLRWHLLGWVKCFT